MNQELDHETQLFLKIANDQSIRQDFLARLQSLGLLASFLAAEGAQEQEKDQARKHPVQNKEVA